MPLPEPMSGERKLRPCAMPVCRGERFDLVHKFPMDNERAKNWLRLINVPELNGLPLDQLRKKYFICSKHFRKIDYKNCESRSLNQTAYPRLFLSTENIDTADSNDATESIDANPQNTDVSSTSMDDKFLLLPESDDQSMYVLNSTISSPIEMIDAKPEDPDPEPEFPSAQQIVMTMSISPTTSAATRSLIRPVALKRAQPTLLKQQLPVKKTKPSGCVFTIQNQLHREKRSSMSDEFLTIDRPSLPKPLRFAHIWLRDHCRCSECYSLMHQRRFNILDIPLDVRPLSHKSTEDVLSVVWSDGHESSYNLNELIATQIGVQEDPVQPQLWNLLDIESADYARVTLNDYLCDDSVANLVVESLVRFGVAFIEKVPANMQSTEVAIKRLFPVQKTFFGEMWTFSDNPIHNDSAYSTEALPVHNDNTYFNDAAGLQIFHCISHSGTGGNTLLTDGFLAAENLRKKDPNAYGYLCKTNVPAEYIEEGRHYKHLGPIIKLSPQNGRPEQIRFNMNDRALLTNIDQSEVKQFYQSYQAFAHEVLSPANEWHFKLNPGTVCIFDNWRILHGRTEYTGKRQVVGCYVARNEFLSLARTMKLID